MSESQPPRAPSEIVGHYDRGVEAGRLASSYGSLELLRTQEILTRFLPDPPATICDVGGGPGVYAAWLARLGYEVHLIDAVELHVQQALDVSAEQPETPITSCTHGDARQLELEENSVDATLLLGPLYHLTERVDRVAALREAWRITRPGGLVFVAAISRFASALDGMSRGFIADQEFQGIVREDLRSGQHRNPSDRDHFLTTAYFHRPEELRIEFASAGLTHMQTLAVEGPAGIIQRVTDQWEDPEWRAQVLATIKLIEAEPALLGSSPHLLAIGRT
ncbi:MAG: class I SAM-dependent methyltransferase [Nitrolancea sp.]